MTSPEPAATEPAEVEVPVVEAPAESRLEQLCVEYEALKPQVDALSARLKTITDGIKVEVQSLQPGATKVTLRSRFLTGGPLRLTGSQSFRMNLPKFKKDHPLLYVQYGKLGSWSWRIERVK